LELSAERNALIITPKEFSDLDGTGADQTNRLLLSWLLYGTANIAEEFGCDFMKAGQMYNENPFPFWVGYDENPFCLEIFMEKSISAGKC